MSFAEHGYSDIVGPRVVLTWIYREAHSTVGLQADIFPVHPNRGAGIRRGGPNMLVGGPLVMATINLALSNEAVDHIRGSRDATSSHVVVHRPSRGRRNGDGGERATPVACAHTYTD